MKYLVSDYGVVKAHIWWFGWKHDGQGSRLLSRGVQVKTHLLSVVISLPSMTGWFSREWCMEGAPSYSALVPSFSVALIHSAEPDTIQMSGFLFSLAVGCKELSLRTWAQIERDRVGGVARDQSLRVPVTFAHAMLCLQGLSEPWLMRSTSVC